MAVDMFIKIGSLEGESKDNTHAKSIDVLAWSWGISQSGTMHVGGGGGAGKASFQDVSVTKYVDNCSTDLALACSCGEHYPEAKLTVRKAGKSPLEYVKITMTDVLVSSISTGGSGGEDRLTENVTLNFAKVKVEYTPQKPDGAADKTKEMTWDIQKNVK